MFAIFRRIFTRKFFMRLAFCTVALFTLIVVAYSVEKWRGQRAWDVYAEAAQKRGVKLWPADYEQPEISDADNYAAVPCIREIARLEPGRDDITPGIPDMRSANRIESYRNEISSAKLPLVEWRDFFVKNKSLAAPTDDPAKDLLALLAERAPALQQLREATPRKGCRFPTGWSDGPRRGNEVLSYLQRCSVLFRVSASARLASGDASGAVDEIRHLLRLGEAMRAQPGLVAGIVGVWSFETGLCAVSDGISAGQWSDADLQNFEQRLATFNPVADLRFAFDSERTFINAAYESIAQGGYVHPFPDAKRTVLEKLGMTLFPSGWVRQNMVKTNEFHDDVQRQIETSRTGDLYDPQPKLRRSKWAAENLGTSGFSRAYWALTRSTVYLFDEGGWSWSSAYSHLAQTRLACALERYHRAHGKYPEKLAALVPEFLPFIPASLTDRTQIYYQAGADGGYVLWDTAAKYPAEGKMETREEALKGAEWVWRIGKR